MDLERDVARHHAHGALAEDTRRALIATGKDPDSFAPADLATARWIRRWPTVA